MHPQARKPASLAAAAVLLVAAALGTHPARAACGGQRDFLVRSDPLLASVRPADCATLLGEPPQFTWPAQDGAKAYTVALRFPDGHTETRSTERNWLAWDRAVPAGEYTWKVSVAGGMRHPSEARAFRVERSPQERKAQPEALAKEAKPAAREGAATASEPASSVFRLEPAESWIPSPKAPLAPRRAAVGGFFGGFTQ